MELTIGVDVRSAERQLMSNLREKLPDCTFLRVKVSDDAIRSTSDRPLDINDIDYEFAHYDALVEVDESGNIRVESVSPLLNAREVRDYIESNTNC